VLWRQVFVKDELRRQQQKQQEMRGDFAPLRMTKGFFRMTSVFSEDAFV
jgi:hypothetical protein